MFGPQPPGHWSVAASASDAGPGHLQPGRRYRVVRPFADYDGDVHPVGEEWDFLGASFLPYDDGLSLFVSLDGVREWQIRLQWRPEEQGAVLDDFSSYLVPVAPAG